MMKPALHIIIFFLHLALFNACGVSLDDAGGYWAPITTTNQPRNRIFHSAVMTSDRMIIWGGLDSAKISTALATGSAYTTATKTWSDLSTTNAPTARYFHVGVWTGSAMLIWGGMKSTSQFLNDGYSYNQTTNTWTAISSTNAPSARARPTYVWTGSKLIVWGGWNGVTWLSDGGIYDPTANTWTTISSTNAPTIPSGAPTTPDYIGDEDSPAVTRDQINQYMQKYLGFTFDNLTAPWSNAVWDSTKNLFYVLGWKGHFSSYNTATNTWTSLTPITLNSKNLFAPVLHSISGSFYTWDMGLGFSYNPTANSWSGITDSAQPSDRLLHTTAVIDNKIVTWGGLTARSKLKTGAVYDPTTGAWANMSTISAPFGRFGHSAVVNGNKMYVFGGVLLPESDTDLALLLLDPESSFSGMAGGVYTIVKDDEAPKEKDHAASCPRTSVGAICVDIFK